MLQDREELFTEKVIAGRRTYYLDIKETSDGSLFLVISETRPTGDGNQERTRVVVFEEHASAFNKAMKSALKFMLFHEDGRERRYRDGSRERRYEEQAPDHAERGYPEERDSDVRE